ncbi:HpcH/HpaI aldolase/citrate lyase family protein [Methylobacterium sp. 37f]|uniref:HpcH/HpaI aldolase/citrate lyase family protein n=1 Tax=Methylobacterium sp. 37f TaxID=2817058 RepID=UPI001FFD88D2|nr:HpcH/HpaI aldolase/citrate lyase family protein [Methylobacterium sp. 37f]MCK2055276.1 HpcH/HpaI aldolase/citrate lyase family protein [Methylobacterium sp. 37f]
MASNVPEQSLVHPYALGATLYMPITHPSAVDVVFGRKLQGLRSVVLCLEDALADVDVPEGLARLSKLLVDLRASKRDYIATPLVFVRPRNLEMAASLTGMPAIDAVDGLVCPKVRPGQVRAWAETVSGTKLRLMPTLETREILDPLAVRDLRDELTAEANSRILALRVGGNDLLACLGLRRSRGRTVYDGPLRDVLANLVNLMVPAGFRLTAPVNEIIDDDEALKREVAEDVAWGFVGKTAIHPSQMPIIHAAFAVRDQDLDAAQLILAPCAPAVFRHDGAMCEPATHRAWATSIIERSRYHGLRPPEASTPDTKGTAPALSEERDAPISGRRFVPRLRAIQCTDAFK